MDKACVGLANDMPQEVMEPGEVYYDPSTYIKTATANLISRKAHIQGPQRVEMRGRVSNMLMMMMMIMMMMMVVVVMMMMMMVVMMVMIIAVVMMMIMVMMIYPQVRLNLDCGVHH